jgi:exodeoxyribonuclease VII large subunit
MTSRRRPGAPGGDLDLFGQVLPTPGTDAPSARTARTRRAPANEPEPPLPSTLSYDRRSLIEPAVVGEPLIDRRAMPDEGPFEDSIPGASPRSAVSITTLTHTARDVLEGAFVPLWVRGEVCDFKAHRNGHWYFCLRDGQSQVRCVVWSRDQRRIPAPPDEGMQIVALAQVTVYAARGELQLSVKAMDAEGDGLRRKALALTLARLDADGLLAPERKRELPRYPRRIAVITSPDGAVLHDIVAVARRRCATVEIVVVATRVQGDGAPQELCAALAMVARWAELDTVIIGRGGGAQEDLRAFNDERVARAVAACPVPIISAVGHEVDITLCDLVADLRAATPSAAAEAAVPVHGELVAELRGLGVALSAAAQRRVAAARREALRHARDVAAVATRITERSHARLERAAARLHVLSPLATLGRGYAVARSPEGHTLSSVRRFRPGDPFELMVRDGTVHATVSDADRDGQPAVPPSSSDFDAA